MSLKELVAKRILDDILGASYKPGKWKVLVMDELGTQIVSSCCKMHDIMEKGITLVESLEKSRAPQLSMEAIYIIWPSIEAIKKLIDDFSDDYRLYYGAHVFLLDRLPPSMFAKLSESKNMIKFLRCLKETYIGFLPKESRVFSLHYPEAFPVLFSPGMAGKGEMKERIADQLATLCATLGEFPAIRCHREVDGMEDIATALRKRLEDLRTQDPSFATGELKSKTELILLDRGFDVVSPLVHELTYQAMVYDLLGIKKDVYTYQAVIEAGSVRTRDIILDESDAVWVKLRHMHFAEVKREVGEMVATFTKSVQRRSDSGRTDMSIKDLHKLIKETPQHHKELSKYSRHLSLVESCDKKFKGGLYELCKAEQDLATGKDETGATISGSMGLIADILVGRKYNIYDKIRLIMLQLLCNQGILKDDFSKVIERAEIPDTERHAILTLASLGYRILTDVKAEGTTVRTGRKGMKRKERLEGRYIVSRWTPVIQDIMEGAVEGTLDDNYCPKLSEYQGSAGRGHSASASVSSSLPQSVRSQRWNWVSGSSKKRTQSQGPAEDPALKVRVIVFVVGGLTHSEIRAAYEVAQNYPSHDIIVGSTHIITPAAFIGQLHQLDIPYRGVK